MARTLIAHCVHKQLEWTPEALVFILGDFNHCMLEFSLPGFSQYVKSDTRKGKTLDKCYGNIPGAAYIAKIKPPIANSDHDTVHLIPKYRPVLKRSKPVLKTVNVWSVDNVETLKGCFMCTDWGVFTQDNPDINTATDSVTDYIKFCIETVIPKKTVKCFPNNKPYITKEIKDCIH